jgi:hypothetical protein
MAENAVDEPRNSNPYICNIPVVSMLSYFEQEYGIGPLTEMKDADSRIALTGTSATGWIASQYCE